MSDKKNMQDYDDMGDRDDDEEMEHYIMKNGEVREQDRYLPIANIARIMKTVLPGNAKIAKDAKESIQECVSEFISFITSEASDKCQQEKRKTINGDDLLWAMSTLGFDKYIEPLKLYLAKYRESVKGEKPEKKPTNTKKSEGSGGMSSSASSQAQPKTSMHSSSYGGSSLLNSSSTGSGNSSSLGMLQSGGLNNPVLPGMKSSSIIPSMSELSSFHPYDGNGGSLLMGGNLEDSPLFLASGGVGANGGHDGGILPPLPKKRKEHPPVSALDMQFPNPKH